MEEKKKDETPRQLTAIEARVKEQEMMFAISPAGQMFKQFELAQRFGQMLSSATIIPDVYKGNVANCAVAADMAMRMNMPPVMVMQNLYVVHGNPAWSSKFLIACIAASGRFSILEYEMRDDLDPNNDDYGCRCVAYDSKDTAKKNPLYGPWVTWKMVKAEGWFAKNGSKWKTMPALMFRYRAAAFWQRLYAPEIALGIGTVEEARDMGTQPQPQVVDVKYQDLTAPAADEPQAPQVTDEQIGEALAALDKAQTGDQIKEVRAAYQAVYEGSEMFRDALIARYESVES